MYFCIYVCIYMSTYIAVLSNAGKPSKIVRPSALDLDVVGDIPKRYRGGETASDRARRKRERHKRERQVQKTREYMELPNKVKNYHRREDNERKQLKNSKEGMKRHVEERRKALNETAALAQEIRLSIKALKDETYQYLDDPTGEKSVDERMEIEIRNSLDYHRQYSQRGGSENRTLRFFYTEDGEHDVHVHANDDSHAVKHKTRSLYKWSLYGSKHVHKCPAGCSGHGICNVDKCRCYRMWDGVDCSMRKCPSGRAYIDKEYYDNYDDGFKRRRVHAYAVCSGRGYCNHQNGTCECIEGYTGSVCERSACPLHKCHGHGKCVHSFGSSSSVSCKCDPPFYGPDCFLQRCPRGDNPKTYIMTQHGPSRNGIQRHNVHSVKITSSVPDVTGYFTLSYKGYYQIEHQTRPIPWSTYHRLPLDSNKLAYAEHVRKSLLMLPNYLFPDVQVSLIPATNGIGFLVTFTEETGNMTDGFTVNHLGCDYNGCQPRFTGLHTIGTITVIKNETYNTSNVENAECSNQGICHPTTGFCKCHEGFKGPACSIFDEYS